jgi:hypothetical protein
MIGSENLENCILTCISAKNAYDRTRNRLTGTSTKDAREQQIRDTLNSILARPNLAEYTVKSGIMNNFNTSLTNGKNNLNYAKNYMLGSKPASAPMTPMDPMAPAVEPPKKKGWFSGGRRSRRGSKKSRKSRKSRKH